MIQYSPRLTCLISGLDIVNRKYLQCMASLFLPWHFLEKLKLGSNEKEKSQIFNVSEQFVVYKPSKGLFLCVLQSCARRSLSLIRIRTVWSAVKIWAIWWGPWATCPLRWNCLNSARTSTWTVRQLVSLSHMR